MGRNEIEQRVGDITDLINSPTYQQQSAFEQQRLQALLKMDLDYLATYHPDSPVLTQL